MTAYDLALPTFVHMLGALKGQLHKGAAFAAAKGSDPADMIGARLARDMFPLATQVRFACFQVLLGVRELAGVETPVYDEDETTFEGLKDRIDQVVEFATGVPEDAFDGAEERAVALALPNGMILDFTGEQFVRDWLMPQFYFHVVTAYAILRHTGVALGKPDYVPYVLPYIRPETFPKA